MNIVWLRRDLRVTDNPALYEACIKQQGVIAVYIETPKTWASHNMGQNQMLWLRQNLTALEQELHILNIPLLRFTTDYFSECPDILLEIMQKYQASKLFYNLEYEWDERRRDVLVEKKLSEHNIQTASFHDQCLLPPDLIFNKQNNPYTVFTPYKKTCLQFINLHPNYLLTAPSPLKQPSLEELSELFPVTPPQGDVLGMKPGHQAAIKQLEKFIVANIENYHQARDFPDLNGTSKLSPYLALGIISTRQVIAKLLVHYQKGELSELLGQEGITIWISELIWRDFYKMICFQYPFVSRNQPFQKHTNRLQWHDNETHLQAWQNGQTGVPIVDAAMRQLNQTGWMHNRLRMVVAMYFTKNLWLDWRLGEAYFASKLVDWDFTANNGGWQWSASTGTDAAPYFRVFNPISQSERFDPEGQFIKQYCPELKSLDKKTVHDPFNRGAIVKGYPKPLVDLKLTRSHAIENFRSL